MKIFFKQISIIAFLIYYITISSGINISLHYCEGELSDIAIITHNTNCQIHNSNSCEGSACMKQLNNASHHQCEAEEQHQCCDNTDVYLALETKSLFSEFNFSIENKAVEIVITIVSDKIYNKSLVSYNKSKTKTKVSYPPPYLAFHKLILYA